MHIILTFLIVFQEITDSILDKKSEAMEEQKMIEVIVHMKNQPDLTRCPATFSKNDKINYLKEFVRLDQKSLIDYLADFAEQIAELRSYWIFNGLYLKTTKDVINKIVTRKDIAYITFDHKIKLDQVGFSKFNPLRTYGYNIHIIKADSCWQEGYDGYGIIIGNIDSGVDTTHPALRGKWLPGGWYDAVNGHPGPYDDHGHGTFTMGIICGGDGNGSFIDDIGVAPGVKFIVAKAFDSLGTAPYSAIHSCLQWFATQSARVINNPYNEGETTSLEFWNDCLNLRNLGIFLVFKGGAISTGEMRTPGNFPTVIGIGATDSLDDITWYSGHGPAPNQNPWNDPLYWYRPDWNLLKPDIVAPGQNIRSSWPGGGYEFSNGTSWAAAHVTGACAILFQKDSTLTPSDLYNTLLDNADTPTQGGPYPNNNYGWGRLNIYSALHSLGLNEKKIVRRPCFQLFIFPNPFCINLTIEFKLGEETRKQASAVRLTIYDASGRVVRLWDNKSALEGIKQGGKISWDGTDNSKNKLPAGVYFVELFTHGEKILEKVILVK